MKEKYDRGAIQSTTTTIYSTLQVKYNKKNSHTKDTQKPPFSSPHNNNIPGKNNIIIHGYMSPYLTILNIIIHKYGIQL